ncbi:phosphate acyltransferase PlsX [Sutcliffiella rhizosphaerae]|uniref:Phosphate acyltransferase n=1 Tax=Sutcliffiella rhizosphaerae TaxID=2880967 RepID=A0ABM8YIN5_9BACI|nr:phosphate acyltransferase PlsX [Sutcliffiella rhizosphaerae]CAG9619744.1 Phosphate acyltransferase [Sutcliffiella rhizosphaerae]
MNIVLDAMGGDHAPKSVVEGVMKAVEKYQDVTFTLVGDEAKIRPFLTIDKNIQILHTEDYISGDEEPVKAVRRKKNSSLVLMAKEVKEGRADACISAGNTGALMAAGLLIVGRIKGIERPALSPTFPTVDGNGFVMLDVGANADAKAEHLFQYALMGSIYAEKVRGIKAPRVGLLNVGTEDNKGNELTKAAFEYIKEAKAVHFIGNVEARDLLNGVADVVVTDGFTGNVTLKAIEGTALSVFDMLKDVLTSDLKSKLAAAVLKPKLKSIKNKMDYSEYGGAALFGLKAPVVKAHGSSDANAVFNAIRQTREMVQTDMVSTISKTIETMELVIKEEGGGK